MTIFTNNKFFSTILTIVLVTITLSASAAKIYDGYVVLNNDEKLEGKIQMLSPSLNEVKVKFISKEGKKTFFKAKEVKEYSFEVEKWNHETRTHDINNIVYIRQNVERSPIAFGPTEVLIERQIAGTINMYNHYVEQNSNIHQPFVHVIYIQKEEGGLVVIGKTNYRKVLKEMVADYPELQAKVGSRGYGYNHIAKTITTYNNWIADNGEEVVLGMR